MTFLCNEITANVYVCHLLWQGMMKSQWPAVSRLTRSVCFFLEQADWSVLVLVWPKPSFGDRFWLGEGFFTPMVCCTIGQSSYSSLFYFRIIVWDAIIYEIVPEQCNGCNWIHLKCSSPICLQTFSQSRNDHQLKAGGQALSAPKQYLKA